MSDYKIVIPGSDLEGVKNINISIEIERITQSIWEDLAPLDLESDKLEQVDWLKYDEDIYKKTQIVLHHTVSGPGIFGDLSTWRKKESHIATCVIIERDGKINQLFSSKYWGLHVGKGIADLEHHSIGVELDSWGQLREEGDYLYNVYGSRVDVPIIRYTDGFRGEKIFEAYTFEQLFSLGQLLLLWNKNYGIPLTYNEDMWDISKRALDGEPGVWGHISFRKDKWDVHPDPQLISLLKYLSETTK